MMSPNQRKILNGLTVFIILAAIVEPFWVFELLHMGFELLIEFLELLFEGIELSLDHIIEFIFDTGSHETQIIVFYIMFSGICYGGYRLTRLVPKCWQRFSDYMLATYLGHKAALRVYWEELSWFGKIIHVVIALALLYLLTLLWF